jgi:hypothetical protein
MGNACDHNLCDEESLCRFCRVFGYGNWPELPERMKHFAAMLDAACGRPGVRPLTYDEMIVLRSTLVEARLKLQEMTEEHAAACQDRDAIRIERDEARREVCVWQGLDTGSTPRDTATVRGWDCYTGQSAMEELARLDEETKQ